MVEIVLIRGLPGSGKSTLAKKYFADHAHFEADMYFVDHEGVYRYQQARISKAHEWCQQQVLISLKQGRNVVVTNTFTRLFEMAPYLRMGYPTTTIIACGNYKNLHGVPEPVIEKMRKRFEYL